MFCLLDDGLGSRRENVFSVQFIMTLKLAVAVEEPGYEGEQSFRRPVSS